MHDGLEIWNYSPPFNLLQSQNTASSLLKSLEEAGLAIKVSLLSFMHTVRMGGISKPVQ